MRILIIGGSGLVGGNCLKQFDQHDGWTVQGTHFNYATAQTVFLDTLTPDHQDNFDVAAFNPDVILHCGALTWVDHCEEFPEKSHQYTVGSTKQVIDWCKQQQAKMVYISTDYVFDGQQGPYAEDAPLNPLSVYGKHKLEAEQLVLQEVPGSLVLRITNVYGDEERGKNFIARLVSAAQKGEELHLKLPVDQYATPVNAADIARALEKLLSDSKDGIWNIASTDLLNRVQLAERVLQYFPGHKVTLEPIFTAELNQVADRPLMGGLLTAKFNGAYPTFRFTNVDDYLNKQSS